MNLVISKCVTDVKVSNFSGHYLRNRSTLAIGVLGYIGIVWLKEHSPEVFHIPPGTPCIYIQYVLGGNVPDFGRMFLTLRYTDITKNIYIWSWMVTEIKAREKCGLLAVLCTVPGSRDVSPIRCACPSLSTSSSSALHAATAHVKWLEP